MVYNSTVLYCIVLLHRTVLYCTELYCTALYGACTSRKGELKYHGNDKSQRGSFGRLNFFLGGPTLSAATCAPSWIADYSCMLNLTSRSAQVQKEAPLCFLSEGWGLGSLGLEPAGPKWVNEEANRVRFPSGHPRGAMA